MAEVSFQMFEPNGVLTLPFSGATHRYLQKCRSGSWSEVGLKGLPPVACQNLNTTIGSYSTETRVSRRDTASASLPVRHAVERCYLPPFISTILRPRNCTVRRSESEWT